MKTRKIIRTYKLKSGKKVTKVYEYTRRSSRGKTLVSKTGKVNKNNVEKLKAQIKSDDSLTEVDKRSIIADINENVNEARKNKRKLTTTGLEGRRTADPIERMFANAGVSYEEEALYLGIDPNELRKESNWSGDEFNYGGRTFRFKFSYTGTLMTEVE